MARVDHITQSDFSGGEISTRMLMRAATEVYKKSVLTMVNYYPTLQGSVERNPGTRFASEIVEGEEGAETYPLDARIIPYITFDNKRSVLLLTEGVLSGISNQEDLLQPITGVEGEVALNRVGPINKPTTISRNRTPNGSFVGGTDFWEIDPVEYIGTDRGLEAQFGVWAETSAIRLRAAKYKDTKPEFLDTCTINHTGTASIDPAINQGNSVYIVADILYADQFFLEATDKQQDQYEAFVNIGTTPGGTDVFTQEVELDVGERLAINENFELPAGFVEGDKLYTSFTLKALATDAQPYSWPLFVVRRIQIFANTGVNVDITTTVGTVPYLAAELEELQFIQSPYGNKELVICHPNHFPHRYFFNGTNFVIEPYIFVDGDSAPFDPWGEAGRYPAACTSFRGRLILAGGESRVVGGTYQTSNTETVWGSNVGRWDIFSIDIDDVNPNHSIEFTSIYRSPIQWVYGQKDLLIGALEMEYVASADGIFSPGDLGVDMHSTHGSTNVQPVGLGGGVLFPAENGTKVRGMNKDDLTANWTSPDYTLLHPELCRSGIVRMVRMRNPHQMAVILLRNGQLALLHQDIYAEVTGWSRFNFSAPIRDIAVTTDEEGFDILWLTVERVIDGQTKLHLEAIYKWSEDNNDFDYMSSSRAYVGGYTSVLTNLEHLEGKQVYVTGLSSPRTDGNELPIRMSGLIGTFRVQDGQVTLRDGNGNLIEVSAARVGMTMTSTLRTLPPEDRDPGSQKRYNSLSVRIRSSAVPRMGVLSLGEPQVDALTRPPVRTPLMPQNVSQFLPIFTDVKITNFGWDLYQTIVIQENLPIRSEILGVYGAIETNSL